MKQRSATIRQQYNLGISSHIMGYYGILWNIMGLYPQHIPSIPPLFLVAAERRKLHRRHGT